MTDAYLKVLAYGAGAIGTYIGGSLALQGHPVVFLEQPAVASELQARGLRLNLNGVEKCIPSPMVAASLEAALAQGPFDLAIFALKSNDTQAALQGMAPFAAKMPTVLCLQNGVENEAALAGVLGGERVIPGTVTSAIGRRAAGDIQLERLRGLGIAANHPLSPTLYQAFNAAGVNAQLFANPTGMKWSKMLTNLLANATSAILDFNARQVFSHPGLFKVEIGQLRETLAVMRVTGIPVTDLPGTPVKLLAFAARSLPLSLSRPLLLKSVASGRGGKMPSFHIDLHSGRGRTEVDYLNGAVVRAGERAGIPTPINRFLNETLIALAQGVQPLGGYAHNPEKLLRQLYSLMTP